MRFDDLRAVAHNMVASFSSGYSLLAGVYQVDVLLEARESKDGFIDIDFLAGTSSDKLASGPLLGAIASFRDALPKLCAKHGRDASAFRQLRARFVSTGGQHRFLVTVEHHKGRLCTDEYVGASVARIAARDDRGRVRPRSRSRTTNQLKGARPSLTCCRSRFDPFRTAK